jgi:hypothetical protein
MPAKCKNNKRRTQHTRERFTQKLNKAPEPVTIERRVHLPNGETLAIAHVNGVYMLARFDKNESPLQTSPDIYGGQDGQRRAYDTVSAFAGRKVAPKRWR